jgi:DNA-binding winged helix-turn-helix (wHTH) protein
VDFDRGLHKTISKIRDILGDSAENPRFIQTVARRGYRFLADVTVISPGKVVAAPLEYAPTRLMMPDSPRRSLFSPVLILCGRTPGSTSYADALDCPLGGR